MAGRIVRREKRAADREQTALRKPEVREVRLLGDAARLAEIEAVDEIDAATTALELSISQIAGGRARRQ